MPQDRERRTESAGAGLLAAEPPLEIREILFPTDLSPAADRAFDHAALLSGALGARLAVLHVVEWPRARVEAFPGLAADEALRRVTRDARERLELQAGALTAPHEIQVERGGRAEDVLLARIQSARPDLVVMATHGREGLSHFFIGSVTEKVLERGGCPVLCVREPQHGRATPYRRLLVGTDLGEGSRRAFPLTRLLATAFGAQVLAVHVVPTPRVSTLSGVPEVVEAIPDEAAVRRFVAADFEGVALEVRIPAGRPWDALVDTAFEERADLIVVAAHRGDGGGQLLAGSHTERVVRHAPCPVLVL
jgi:nucleotide-binding universal stress UspA family protein